MVNQENQAFHLRLSTYLWEAYEGDWLMRQAFLEYLEQEGKTLDVYQTAMEASIFPLRIGQALAEFAWNTKKSPAGNGSTIFDYTYGIMEAVRGNFAVPDWYDSARPEVYLFALADRDAVVEAVSNLSNADKVTLRDRRRTTTHDEKEAIYAKVAKAISNPFTLKPQHKKYPIAFLQGYPDGRPRGATLSTKTGTFYMTKNGLSEFGLSIPKQEWTVNNPADLAKKAIRIESKIKTHHVVATSDADSPTTIEVTDKLHNFLTIDDLLKHAWTFSLKEKPAPQTLPETV